jgi:hypothetical protein
MRAARATLIAAIVANVLGWVLPAISDERGYEAFVFALSPLWDKDMQREAFPLLVFIVASALTNVLFIVLVVTFVLRKAPAKAVLWGAAAAALLNLYWPILLEADRARLQAGYFIWVSSFAVLALSAFLALRSAPR